MKAMPIYLCALLITPELLAAQPTKEFSYNSKGKRDPFVPWTRSVMKDKAGNGTDGLRVEGIIIDPLKGSLVVINGTVLKEGDSMGTYKVAKIQKKSVLLINHGETIALHLESEE